MQMKVCMKTISKLCLENEKGEIHWIENCGIFQVLQRAIFWIPKCLKPFSFPFLKFVFQSKNKSAFFFFLKHWIPWSDSVQKGSVLSKWRHLWHSHGKPWYQKLLLQQVLLEWLLVQAWTWFCSMINALQAKRPYFAYKVFVGGKCPLWTRNPKLFKMCTYSIKFKLAKKSLQNSSFNFI